MADGPARVERMALCDLFLAVGPDAPTLSGSWSTRDLAAHLVVRERRPDAAIGIVTTFLANHGERVRLEEAERPYPEIVERVRRGPPIWSPTHVGAIDTLANSIEFFVHHEDVRRAGPVWDVRSLSTDLEDALAGMVERGGRLLARRCPVGIAVDADGRQEMRLRSGTTSVTIRGPIGECVLYLNGRKDVAQVALEGPDDALAAVAAAPFGI
ncbi:MAG: TIGR03085 family metal-binding protein [Ilumatobacteraceae bacterium]